MLRRRSRAQDAPRLKRRGGAYRQSPPLRGVGGEADSWRRRAAHGRREAAGGEQRRVPLRLCCRRWLGRVPSVWVSLVRGSLVRSGSGLAHVSSQCTPRNLPGVGVMRGACPRAYCAGGARSPLSIAAGIILAHPH
jgi:hypothetical protein